MSTTQDGQLMEAMIMEPYELAQLAARAIQNLLRSRPDGILGLAIGSSPLPIYDELVRLHDGEGLSFARATALHAR
jgi:glucosamine-6-phosphate deaminase